MSRSTVVELSTTAERDGGQRSALNQCREVSRGVSGSDSISLNRTAELEQGRRVEHAFHTQYSDCVLQMLELAGTSFTTIEAL